MRRATCAALSFSMLLASIEPIFSQTGTIREGGGGGRSRGGGKVRLEPPRQNPNCNEEKRAACEVKAKEFLKECKFSPLFDCKGHAMLDYSE
jgi:hypothetical protein